MRIGTIRGAPSDRVLTREIKAAEIVRIPLSPTIAADAVELRRSGKADVFGADSGVGYPAAQTLPGAKIVPGTFAMVRVAAALPKGRSAAAQAPTKYELVVNVKASKTLGIAIPPSVLGRADEVIE